MLRNGDLFLEKYQVLHQLGEGAYALVYKARHQVLDRDVAIKLLRVDDPVAVKRFEIEAKVISRLTHPATVRVHDYGLWGRTPYMVLEFVAGRTLRDVIDWRGSMDPDRVVGVLVQILESLAEAHDLKVIHRDLKPRNVMVFQPFPDRAIDRVKVLDFGLAKVLPPSTTITHPGRITEKGVTVGTVRYMAPEQIRARYVGPASDIFSVGMIAYEMLTGHHPYAHIEGFDSAIELLSDAPIRLPETSEIGEDLAAIVAGMLEKDHTKRPSDARYIVTQLDGLGDVTAEVRGALEDIMREAEVATSGANDVENRSYVSLMDRAPFSEDS